MMVVKTKKQKVKCAMTRKLKFENYNNYFKAF